MGEEFDRIENTVPGRAIRMRREDYWDRDCLLYEAPSSASSKKLRILVGISNETFEILV